MADSSQAESVVQGLWRNYDLPAWRRTQFLVKDQTAQMISNAVAILLALVLRRLVVFAKILLPLLAKCYSLMAELFSPLKGLLRKRQRTQVPRPDSSSPESILMEPPRARIAAGATQTFVESTSFEEAASRIISRHLAMSRVELSDNDGAARSVGQSRNIFRNLRDDFWAFTWLSALALLLFALYIGQQAIAISAASIITGSEALMSSPVCGVWFSEVYRDQKIVIGNNNLTVPLTSYAADRSLKGISYADTCYRNDSRPEECSYYYKSKIPFLETHNASCPFGGDLCLYGNTGAYSLDSGLLDSSLLGINEKNRCKFRLQSTCAPLVTDEPYVRSRPGERNGSLIVDYYFGNVNNVPGRDENLTFTWTFNAPSFDSLMYRSKRYMWEEFPLPGPGRPSSNFRAELIAPNSTTYLFFVYSQDVLFTAASSDPIFPNVRGRASTGFTGIYWNPQQHHTILACTETVSLHHPRSGAAFFPSLSPASVLKGPEWQNPSVVNSVVLLNLSLHVPEYFANDYSHKTSSWIVNKKKATVFGASTPLAPEQWKQEARRMFEVRAARWQIDVLGAGAGAGWDLVQAKNALRDYSGKVEWEGDLDLGVDVDVCQQIKFRASGWKNISLSGLLIMMMLASAIWISTIELGNEKEVLLVWATRELIVPGVKWLWSFVKKLWSGRSWKLSLFTGRRHNEPPR